MCCWTAERSPPPTASAPAVRWRPATELEGAESSVNDKKACSALVGFNL